MPVLISFFKVKNLFDTFSSVMAKEYFKNTNFVPTYSGVWDFFNVFSFMFESHMTWIVDPLIH